MEQPQTNDQVKGVVNIIQNGFKKKLKHAKGLWEKKIPSIL